MDTKEDMQDSLILDRHFIKIAKVIIGVDEEKLRVRSQDHEVIFNAFEVLLHPNDKKDCSMLDASNETFFKLSTL